MNNLPQKVDKKSRIKKIKKIKEERKKRIKEEKQSKSSNELALKKESVSKETVELGSSKFSFSSIRSQITLSFAAIGLILIVLVGFTLHYFSDVEKRHNDLANQKTKLMTNLLTLDKFVKESSLETMSFLNSNSEDNLNDQRYLWKNIKKYKKFTETFINASNNNEYLSAFVDYQENLIVLEELQEKLIQENVSLNESSFYLQNMKTPVDLLSTYANKAFYNKNTSKSGELFFNIIDSIQKYTTLYNQKALELCLLNDAESQSELEYYTSKLEETNLLLKSLKKKELAYYFNSVGKINDQIDQLVVLTYGLTEEVSKKNGKQKLRLYKELSTIHKDLELAARTILDKEDESIVNETKALSTRIVNVKNLEYWFLGGGLVVSIILAFLAIKRIVHPIQKLRDVFAEMTKGILPEKIEGNNNEIGDVILATNIFVDSLKETANFANSIGEGNLTKEYAPLGKDDSLGHSLLEMREKLKVASQEDKIREWKIKRVTRFSELLRQNADDLELFGFNIISELTKSIGADQGAIFALEEGNEYNYLKMIGCYAFERRKYINKEVLKGEGIIGQCWQEKGSIHLKEIPQSYIKIKSGLGDSQPKEVLAVPLIEADEVFGIIEIASFKALDSYKIEYVQELCESIASTLKGIKINVQTQQLLTDSKKMTESMRSQEEELRQTAEEMQATTEDLEQRIREDKKESDEIIRNLKEKIRQLEGK